MDVTPSTGAPERGVARPKLVLVSPCRDDPFRNPASEVLPGKLAAITGFWAAPRKGRSGRRRQVLLIDARLPDGNDAGPGSVLSEAVALRRLGFQVMLAPVDGTLDRPGDLLARHGLCTLGRPVHRSVEEVLQRHADAFDLVIIHGTELARAYEPLVRLHGPAARVVCRFPGLLHPELFRQAEAERRPDLVRTARAVQRQELLAAYACDAAILSTEADARVVQDALPGIEACSVSPQEFSGEATDRAFCRVIEGQQRLRLAVR